MEYKIKRISTESWSVSACSCGEEPELFEWVDSHNVYIRRIILRCPKCYQRATSDPFIAESCSFEEELKGRYYATIGAIAAWENMQHNKASL